LAPVVVALLVVVVAVAVVFGLIGVTLAGLGRHRSRTRDQASTIFTLRTAVVAMVQAATQGYEVAADDGSDGGRRRVGTPWASVDSTVRPTITTQLPLIQDAQLRRLTTELLEATRRLSLAGDTDEGARLCGEVDDLHKRFRTRSNEVVRELNLGRVPPGR